jgi:hypothetical protein
MSNAFNDTCLGQQDAKIMIKWLYGSHPKSRRGRCCRQRACCSFDGRRCTVMKADGVMVLFADVVNGTMGVVNLSNVYLSNAQYTSTSCLTIDDQASVMARRVAGTLSPGRSVAAIGGLETAVEAIESVIEGKYPGKVVIFPQIRNLPLMGLKELKERMPEVAAKLGEELMWTNDAEVALIEKMWKNPE